MALDLKVGDVTPSKWAEARQAGSELSKPVEWSRVVKDSPTQRVLFQLGFGSGTLLNDMCASCWFNFLFVFLERVQGLSGAQVGAVFLTGQLCDAVSTPLIGLLADWAQGLYVCGLGRRQVFYLLGATIVSLSFVFVFGVCLPCVASPNRLVGSDERTLFFAAAAGIFNIGWAASHNSHQSLVPELTPVETERVSLNAVRYSAFVCSNILVLVSMLILLATNAFGSSPATEDSPLLYKTITGIVLGLGACCAAVFLTIVRAAPPTAAKAAALPAPPGTATVAAAAKLPGRTPLMWLAKADYCKTAACYITMRLATNITTLVSGALCVVGAAVTLCARTTPLLTPSSPPHAPHTLPSPSCSQYMALFLTTSLGMEQGAIAAIPLVIFACSLATVSQLTALTQRLGVRKTLCAGVAVFSLGSASILLLPPAVSGAMYAAAAALGTGLAAITVSVATLQSSLLGSDTSSAGFVFGSMSALDKLVVGVVVLGVQIASDSPGLSLPDFFRYTLGLAPLASMGVCALLALSISSGSGEVVVGEGGSAQQQSVGTPNPLNVTSPQSAAVREGGEGSSSGGSAEEGAGKASVDGSPAVNPVV